MISFVPAQTCRQTWVRESYSEVVKPLRLTASIAVAAAAFVPAIVISGIAFTPPRGAPDPYWHRTPGSVERDLAILLTTWGLSVVVASLAGGFTYFGLGRLPPQTEADALPPTRRAFFGPAISRAILTAPGLPGRQTSGSSVDLTLDEALGLELGELYLDGGRVKVSTADVERLSFLPLCNAALKGFQAHTEQPFGALQLHRLWEQANMCDRHWAFADEVIKSLAPMSQD